LRHYPQGVDSADQTQRLRMLVAIYGVLDMSLRSVVMALAPFGVELNFKNVWRDLQEQAGPVEQRRC
jgi:hypothetical protein